jgi:hypothetical protein
VKIRLPTRCFSLHSALKKKMLRPIALCVAFLLAFYAETAVAETPGVTSNVLLRTKKILVGPASATAFTIDVDQRQYIVTAKHVVATLATDSGAVKLCEGPDRCSDFAVRILRCVDPIDIAVLVPDRRVSEPLPLQTDSKGLTVGQRVFFVGFPYGDDSLSSHVGVRAIGFVRQAVVSAAEFDAGYMRVYLDGRNNEGFSGAPVVFVEPGRPGNKFKVAAVVSGYRTDYSRVMRLVPIKPKEITPEDRALNLILDLPDGSHLKLLDTQFVVPGNTGIVVAYGIKHAVELIRSSDAKGPEVRQQE